MALWSHFYNHQLSLLAFPLWKGIGSNSLQNEILKNVFASQATLAKMDDSRFGFIVLVLGQNGFVRHLFGKGLICDWNILKGKASDSPGLVPSYILNHHCLEKSLINCLRN